MAAGIPGVEVEIRQVEFIDQMGHAPAVFVAAMEEQYGTPAIARGGRPAAIEQGLAIGGREMVFFCDSGHGLEAAMPL
jgi:hypothetical protein